MLSYAMKQMKSQGHTNMTVRASSQEFGQPGQAGRCICNGGTNKVDTLIMQWTDVFFPELGGFSSIDIGLICEIWLVETLRCAGVQLRIVKNEDATY